MFNPDKWMTSMMRSLEAYVEAGLLLTGAATDPYEVEMSYPPPELLSQRMPLKRTLIHLEVEEPDQVFFGLGDNKVNVIVDEDTGTIEEWEAHCHEVTVNVGIWASVESGGPSARMEARQDLDALFNGPIAFKNFMTQQGMEILSFTGGRHVTDVLADAPVFRTVDLVLRLRVFSRSKETTTYIDSVTQAPELTIDSGVSIVG